MKKAFTLIEILVSVGIIMTLTLLSIAAYAPAKKNALTAQVISAVSQTDANIRMYYTKYREYPDTLNDLVTTRVVPKLPNIPGSTIPIFYQKDYTFHKFNTDAVTTISNPTDSYENPAIAGENSNWRSNDNLTALPTFLKNIALPAGVTSEVIEQKRQFYGVDINATGECSYLTSGSGASTVTVAYRLGAPLPKPDGRALSDGTPCTDRFIDIIVR